MPDSMTIRLHLRRLRVVEVLEDLIDRVTVLVADLRSVVRCPHCRLLTGRVYVRRRQRVHDLAHEGRPTAEVPRLSKLVQQESAQEHGPAAPTGFEPALPA